MAFTENTLLGEVLDNPAAKACMEKHYPEMKTMGGMLSMARGMSFLQVAGFPQANLSPERLEAILQDLNNL